MSGQNQKAYVLRENLASEMAQRLPALAQTKSVDSSDNGQCLLLGDGVATHANAFIKIVPISWPNAKDVLGLQATVYTPNVIQICVEAVSGAGAEPLPWADKLPILAALAQRGTRIEIYETATATAPSLAGIISGNLKATFEASQKWGMQSSI